MSELLLLLAGFVFTLCALTAVTVMTAHARRERIMRQVRHLRDLHAELRDLDNYIHGVGQARSDTELDSLEREREDKWDGSS